MNVTTTRPSDDRLYKTSQDDEEYGAHAIISDSEIVPDKVGAAGFAWIGGLGSEYYSGAIVLPITIGGGDPKRASVKAVAEAITHEVGHDFGLAHQGIDDGSGPQEYYAPLTGLWAPIMGEGALTPISQWTRGDYAGATKAQDDIATSTDRTGRKYVSYDLVTADGESYAGALCPVGDANLADPAMGDRFQETGAQGECDGTGAPLTPLFTFVDRADPAEDVIGDDAAGAQKLEAVDGAFSSHGLIERQDDVDVFRISVVEGELTARVAVAEISPNLDAKLTLTDASGAVVAESDEATERVSDAVADGLGAEITARVAAGDYYLTVDGVGAGDSAEAAVDDAHGYTDYGSLGNYVLSGSLAQSGTGGGDSDEPDGGGRPAGGAVALLAGGVAATALVVIGILLVRARRRSRAS